MTNKVVDLEDDLRNIVLDKLQDDTTPILSYIHDACYIIQAYAPTFMSEYCAVAVHDTEEGGLARHTCKVFHELISMLYGGTTGTRFYSKLINQVDLPSLIVGCILHDVGKTLEYNQGKKSNHGYVPHTLSGIEFVAQFKETIIKAYGPDSYLRILSIIGQHHGDFGEKPQTIEAYLVHLADYQETKLQILEEAIAKGKEDGEPFTGKYLPYKLY